MNFGARYLRALAHLAKTSDRNSAYLGRPKLREDDSCNCERGSDGRASPAPLTLDNRRARPV